MLVEVLVVVGIFAVLFFVGWYLSGETSEVLSAVGVFILLLILFLGGAIWS